ncbi:hypothetical protein C8J57DRAFT_1236629 [Mycena rebaudengoi]|nr:hypothetical protein C8J57DRAFT_1236629 [Mycena rebaudengoi]
MSNTFLAAGRLMLPSAVEPAGAAGYLRRTNTNDLILFFQKFCCGQANAASELIFPVQCQNILASFVQISWPPVAPVVSEGIFSSIHSSGPEMNISEYDILLSSKKRPRIMVPLKHEIFHQHSTNTHFFPYHHSEFSQTRIPTLAFIFTWSRESAGFPKPTSPRFSPRGAPPITPKRSPKVLTRAAAKPI